MIKGLLKQAISFSRAGYTIFKCVGKVPQKGLSWPNYPYTMPSDVEEYLGDWDHNYGLALEKNQLVIDIDPRNFQEGDQPHHRLFKSLGGDIRGYSTTVKTGGGGLHVFLHLPDLPDGLKISKNPKISGTNKDLYPGIDFLTHGSYAIGAGSLHPKTGRAYELLSQPFPDLQRMATAPQELIDILTIKKAPSASGRSLVVVKDNDPQTIERFTTWLRGAPIAIEGESGDQTTYNTACRGRDYGLSEQKTYELMSVEFNPRCEPPWDEEALVEKVQHGFRYATGDAGSKSPEADFENLEVADRHTDWRGWDRVTSAVGNGKAKTLNNTINYFINFHETTDNKLHNSIMFNDFTHEVTKRHWLPWDGDKKDKKFPQAGVEWADHDTINLTAYMSVVHKFDISQVHIKNAIVTVAQKKRIHPVRQYFDSLTWDGEPRLEKWLIKNTGAEDTQLNRVGSKLLILQAVARVMQPGCQADVVFILEGNQGIGKSSIVRILGGEYYADVIVDPNNKDTPDAMRGKWFLEMSEMAVNRRADAESLKSFLTRPFDRYRAPYAHKPSDVMRQSVFIGTINVDAMGEYLNDPTGGRRFWPIDLNSIRVNREGIQRIRDQLFAEAHHCIIQGAAWHTENEKLLAKLNAEQKRRQYTDSWAPMVEKYVGNKYFVTAEDVYLNGIQGMKKDINRLVTTRIATCLREMGYSQKIKKIDGKSRRGWANEAYKEALDDKDIRGMF